MVKRISRKVGKYKAHKGKTYRTKVGQTWKNHKYKRTGAYGTKKGLVSYRKKR